MSAHSGRTFVILTIAEPTLINVNRLCGKMFTLIDFCRCPQNRNDAISLNVLHCTQSEWLLPE